MKREYPLFIIDSSRAHGRCAETDYISCTSNELPFVAAVTMHKDNEYVEMYDSTDKTCIWSDARNGIRMRIKVVSILPDNYPHITLQNLLRRALKEMLIRRNTQYVCTDAVQASDTIQWVTIVRQQVTEHLRENPDDKQQRTNLAILTKILEILYKE